jgi:hypothetical protein
MKTEKDMYKVEISEFVNQIKSAFGGKIKYKKDLKLINIRGCNGSGKSTVPMMMLANDDHAFLLTYKGKTRATVFPSYKCVALGKYFAKTGGMDGFKNNEETRAVLDALYDIPYDIIMEGIIASTIFSTYAELFKELENRQPKRQIGIMNLLPPMDVVKERVLGRNGGNAKVKWEQIEGKRRTVERNAQKFKDEGLNSWTADNSKVELGASIEWFFNQVSDNLGGEAKRYKPVEVKDIKTESTPKKELKRQETQAEHSSDGEFLRSMNQEIKPYWEKKYLNVPDDSVKLRVDPETGRTFWDMYFVNMVERQNIWHKRVIENKPRPWTEDEIMANYHFTNVDRKLDRVTLHYIDNVLPNFVQDCETGTLGTNAAKKFLIFNTFIYRLFVRPETWDVIGYIHPDTWETDWENGKERLREYKRKGNTVWTDAYFVNDLKSANPDKANSSDKLENAFHLFQYVLDNLDEIADFVFDKTNNMESVVNYLTRVPAVGMFTSYEVCLDLGMVNEMTGIDFVDWTADHWINIGPGCKKGIDYVFENKGNMSYENIVFFVMSVYKSEFERLGLEYKFQPGTNELDGRCLEGWFCESQKWFNYYCNERGYEFAKGKRPKKKMNLRTDNIENLKPRN